MLETYKKLVDFLGLILGEHCKIVLFDLMLSPPAVVAIANGTMEGGKGIGAPLTRVARDIIESGEWKNCDYKSEFLGRTRNGELLKSSYFFIKDSGRLIGMLSINSSATQYQRLCQEILRLGGFSNLLRTFGKYLTNIPHDMEVLFLEHFGGGRGGGGVGAWRRAFSPV